MQTKNKLNKIKMKTLQTSTLAALVIYLRNHTFYEVVVGSDTISITDGNESLNIDDNGIIISTKEGMTNFKLKITRLIAKMDELTKNVLPTDNT